MPAIKLHKHIVPHFISTQDFSNRPAQDSGVGRCKLVDELITILSMPVYEYYFVVAFFIGYGQLVGYQGDVNIIWVQTMKIYLFSHDNLPHSYWLISPILTIYRLWAWVIRQKEESSSS